jgi:hypothetical protein
MLGQARQWRAELHWPVLHKWSAPAKDQEETAKAVVDRLQKAAANRDDLLFAKDEPLAKSWGPTCDVTSWVIQYFCRRADLESVGAVCP